MENFCSLKYERELIKQLFRIMHKSAIIKYGDLPPPIPPVETESAVTPFTVAREGRKRQLQSKMLHYKYLANG